MPTNLTVVVLVSDNLGGADNVDDNSPKFHLSKVGKGKGGDDDDVSISLTQYYLKGSV